MPPHASSFYNTAIVSSLLFLSACASRPLAPPRPLSEDLAIDETHISIAGISMPELPLDVESDEPPLEQGWVLAERALATPTPIPPVAEAWEVQEWVDQELANWIERRVQSLVAAQRALEPARQDEARFGVVASAVLGLLYSRFAMDLRGIEVPMTFREDPRLRAAFTGAMQRVASPLWQRAIDAFGSCSRAASMAPAHSLGSWQRYCDTEIEVMSDMLEGNPEEGEEASDE